MSNDPANYTVLKSLGTAGGGLNGGILIVKHRHTGHVRVEKKFQAEMITKGYAATEVAILTLLEHEYISRILDARNGSLWLELAEGGSLDGLIERHSSAHSRIPEDFIWTAFDHISRALRFCHWGVQHDGQRPSRQWLAILHCDVKPQNILIKVPPARLAGTTLESSLQVVLCDFGVSSQMHKGEKQMHFNGGTVAFWPPEQAKNSIYRRRSDVWQLAATLGCAVLLKRSAPPQNLYGTEAYSKELIDLIEKCALPKLEARPDSCNLPFYVRREFHKVQAGLAANSPSLILPHNMLQYR